MSTLIYSCGEQQTQTLIYISKIQVPQQTVRPPVIITFKISSNIHTQANLNIKYSTNNGKSWDNATIDTNSSPLYGIELTPKIDKELTILWDAYQDIDSDFDDITIGILNDNSFIAKSDEFSVNISNKPPRIELTRDTPKLFNNNTYFEISAYDSDNQFMNVRAKIIIDKASSPIEVSIIDAAGVKHKSITVENGEKENIRLDILSNLQPGIYRNTLFSLIPYDELGAGEETHWIADIETETETSITCLNPNGIQRGVISVLCTLYGNKTDKTLIKAYFRNPLTPDTDWQKAYITEPTGYVNLSPNGVDVLLKWLSSYDIPLQIANGVEFEARIMGELKRSRIELNLNNAPAVSFVAISEIFSGSENLPKFIELYGNPNADLSGYALLEVRRDGQYDRTRMRGFFEFPEGLTIPRSGFLTLSASSIGWADIVDERINNFFLFGFPTNLLIIKPLDSEDFFNPDKTPIIDAVGFGEFDYANVFLGKCEYSRRKAEESGNELSECPLSSAAPAPNNGFSVCRTVSNLDVAENRMDFSLCTPSPGSGKLLPLEE